MCEDLFQLIGRIATKSTSQGAAADPDLPGLNALLLMVGLVPMSEIFDLVPAICSAVLSRIALRWSGSFGPAEVWGRLAG